MRPGRGRIPSPCDRAACGLAVSCGRRQDGGAVDVRRRRRDDDSRFPVGTYRSARFYRRDRFQSSVPNRPIQSFFPRHPHDRRFAVRAIVISRRLPQRKKPSRRATAFGFEMRCESASEISSGCAIRNRRTQDDARPTGIPPRAFRRDEPRRRAEASHRKRVPEQARQSDRHDASRQESRRQERDRPPTDRPKRRSPQAAERSHAGEPALPSPCRA